MQTATEVNADPDPQPKDLLCTSTEEKEIHTVYVITVLFKTTRNTGEARKIRKKINLQNFV
jgi:hypothetical protein